MKTKVLGMIVVVIGTASLLLSGCGDAQTSAKTTVTSPPPSTAQALPAGLILKEAPTGAKDVGALKKDAKEGDEIVIRGQIGGRPDVFNAGRATFLIADMKFPACNMKPGDKCETPWDFCCETPEAREANTAAIQVTDPDGKILKADVRGVSGIDYLSVVVIKGKVAKREEKNLVVNATGIYVEKVVPLPH